jgi:hypothetical protein
MKIYKRKTGSLFGHVNRPFSFLLLFVLFYYILLKYLIDGIRRIKKKKKLCNAHDAVENVC